MKTSDTKISFRKLRFKLEAAGFTEIRQLNNHAKFVHRDGAKIRTAILPHYAEISVSVFKSVLKQAGLNQEDFDKL